MIRTKGEIKSTYQCWSDMKQRCYNPNAQQYKNYGERGISVCKSWIESFDNFLSDMGVKPDGMSIERINVNGNYEPSNCKWATALEQARNQRNRRYIEFNGLRMTTREWATKIGISEAALARRSNIGWTPEQMITTPVDSIKTKSGIAGNKVRWGLVEPKTMTEVQRKMYTRWQAIRYVCNNKDGKNYKYYGGIGVTVCPEWNDFHGFLKDMGEPEQGMTFSRIDKRGNFTPENCQWVPKKKPAAIAAQKEQV